MLLITGAAGTMGRKLARALASRGPARALCLPGDPGAAVLAGFGLEVALGDITRPETLPAALHGVEAVFHLAAVVLAPGRPEVFRQVNVEGTRHLLAAAEAAGASHFIFVSSVSVLYPWTNAYARSKREAEELVRRARIPHYTIVRPSLAYEDGGAAEFMHFAEYLRRAPLPLLPGGGAARKSPVHVDDLVAGFLTLPGNPKAYGKTYHFTGGETLTLRQLAHDLLGHMGRRKPLLGVPLWACRAVVPALDAWGRLTGRPGLVNRQSLTGLAQDAAPDNREAREDLGWRPRPFREGLAGLHSLRGNSPPGAAAAGVSA